MSALTRPDTSVYLSESSPPRPASLNLADSELYLDRINLDKHLAHAYPSYELLSKLSVAHHLSVPFDTSALHVPLDAWAKRDDRNLAIKEGPGVELGKANFERIVKRRHGGFCYSQNPLFASLLRGFGFRVSEVAARVFMNRGKDPKEAGYAWSCNTHVALIVYWSGSDGRYLVDVGFGGGGPPYPIPLRDGQTAPSLSKSESFLLREETMPVGDAHPILHDPPAGWTLYRRIVPVGAVIRDHTKAEMVPDSFWTPCIHFSLATMTPEDIMMGNHFNCTHDSAGFARVFVVSRLLANGGRQTLSRGIPAIDAGAPDDGTAYAKLYSKDSIKGEEHDIEWVPYDVKSIGKVLEDKFGFTL
ncbi:hypothetical protein JCM10908_004352 [Rhodotorula pacifica]|uniref:uncharacterized protein n=1 Tax=Rhodotorula pacifica TaxID=1495444 RepID=UPI0031758C60